MDHRSGSASQGTSPLKAAGFLVGLLVVVALAFALGMKAGRELDVLRPERGGETVKLAEAKPAAESAGGARRDDTASKRPDASSHPRTTAGSGEARPEAAAPAPPTEPLGAASAAAVGDEPPSAASAAPASEPLGATPSTRAGPDYTIFKSTSGAAGAKSASSASSAAATPATESPAKATPAKPIEATKPAKEAATEKETKVAAAKPSPAAVPKPTSSTGQLKITPDSPDAASKPADKSSPGFVVQVAALQNKGDADQLATRLRAHGAAPYINKVELPNGTWYRVRVGKYKTPAEAKAAQKKLAAAGFRGAEVMSAR